MKVLTASSTREGTQISSHVSSFSRRPWYAIVLERSAVQARFRRGKRKEGKQSVAFRSLHCPPQTSTHTRSTHDLSLSLSLSLSLTHELSKSAGADADVSLTENGRRWIEDSISLVLTSIHTRLWHRIQIMVRDD